MQGGGIPTTVLRHRADDGKRISLHQSCKAEHVDGGAARCTFDSSTVNVVA